MEDFIDQKKIVLRYDEVPNVIDNLFPAHNNGTVIGMICEDKKFDPALKVIIAIAESNTKPKVTPKKI